ncbi:MAG TPA: transposase [Candidatus Binatia bacterium]|jgi:putative transposase|nr:transposase [Candidatus Binatia bacterium]
MTQYRRASVPGATWFFTVNLAERNSNRLLVDEVDTLRSAFRTVQATHSFRIDAAVILPDHLHCIWTLPPGDSDFSTRWALIKGNFSRAIEKGEQISQSRAKRDERGLWQRRFWEHLIRDEEDLKHHTDYIHWNPVKHGWVQNVLDWPHSSFHAYVRRGVYEANWVVWVVQILKQGSDAIDAVPFGHHILRT